MPGALAHVAGLRRDGYLFWENLRRRRDTSVISTRLLHEEITVVRGADAAEFFYETDATRRSSALPTGLVGPLFGEGPVHMLDGSAHAHRKQMFNDILGAAAVAEVADGAARRWSEEAARWRGEVDLVARTAPLLLEAACSWVGVQLPYDDRERRARDMLDMVDGFGAFTVRQARARRARRRTDAWITALVEEARRSHPGGQTPLEVIARHTDEDGVLLPAHTAAVEVINLLRPIVAVSWLVDGLVRAVDTVPALRAEILSGEVTAFEMAQEVRRTYPFVPFLATRVVEDLRWDDVTIPAGTLLVLDVWGTNHDPRTWRDPEVFDPTRFRITPVTPYNLVPQGGGSRYEGHRCPGEDVTLAILAALAGPVAALPATVLGPPLGVRRMPPQPACRVQVTAGTAPARDVTPDR
ncbi:hypothetical protein BHE97_09115 [Aeromicrobium sp. PE09-221]|nr:hypothetical protein BHE97_09115 [Aeromicrobium sp. PE09-221]